MKSQNVLRPGQNQLIFLNHLKEYNIYYPNASSPQLNVVSEVQATKMARTVHANAITSPQGRNFEAGIHQNFFMTIFVFDCMKKCFLIKYKFDQILWEKALKMKVKVIDVSSTKSSQFFLIFRNCQLFHFGQVIEYNKINIFLQKLCRK